MNFRPEFYSQDFYFVAEFISIFVTVIKGRLVEFFDFAQFHFMAQRVHLTQIYDILLRFNSYYTWSSNKEMGLLLETGLCQHTA